MYKPSYLFDRTGVLRVITYTPQMKNGLLITTAGQKKAYSSQQPKMPIKKNIQAGIMNESLSNQPSPRSKIFAKRTTTDCRGNTHTSLGSELTLI